jgi:hypothetical protein
MKAKMKKLLIFVFACSAVACHKETSVSSSTSTSDSTTSSSSTTYYYQSGSTVTQTGETYYSTISDTGGVEVTTPEYGHPDRLHRPIRVVFTG